MLIPIFRFDRQRLLQKGPLGMLPGPHAENYLNECWFMHLRLREHAHLPNDTSDARYHFGTSVYASKDEAREFLEQIWNQLLDEQHPELGLRPIILLHHGPVTTPLSGSICQDLGFDPSKMDATIAILDNQVIADQTKITSNRYPEINYILGPFKIAPHDFGNCGNAAAYMTIVSMLATLKQDLYYSRKNPKSKPGRHGPSESKTTQMVVDWLMERPTPAPPIGQQVYCHRCGSDEHYFVHCPNTDFVCNVCQQSPVLWKQENAKSHKEGLCIFRAKFSR